MKQIQKTRNKLRFSYCFFIVFILLSILLSRYLYGIFEEYSGNTGGRLEVSLKSAYQGNRDSDNVIGMLFHNDLLRLKKKYPRNMLLYYSEIDSRIEETGRVPVSVRITLSDEDISVKFYKQIINGSALYPKLFETGEKYIVISERLATELYMSADVLGNKISLNGEAYSIAGIYKDRMTIFNCVFQEETERVFIPYKSYNGYEKIPVQKIVFEDPGYTGQGFRADKLTDLIRSVTTIDLNKYIVDDLYDTEIIVRQFYKTILLIAGLTFAILVLSAFFKYLRLQYAKINELLKAQYFLQVCKSNIVPIIGNAFLLSILVFLIYLILNKILFMPYVPDEVISGLLSFDGESFIKALKVIFRPFFTGEEFLGSQFVRLYYFIVWVDTALVFADVIFCILFINRFKKIRSLETQHIQI